MRPLSSRWIVSLLSLGLAVGAAACSRATSSGTTPRTAPAEDRNEQISLDIANHNWLDVIVYVVHDGQRTRVGVANATSAASFTLPARLLGQGREIRLFGDPIGGRGSALSEVVVVQPGQYIEWTLESDLGRSVIGVY